MTLINSDEAQYLNNIEQSLEEISTIYRGNGEPLLQILPNECYLYVDISSTESPLWIKTNYGWINLVGVYHNPRN